MGSQDIEGGGGRKYNPTWEIQDEGLSEELRVQRASDFKKYNSRLELKSNRVASKNRLYIPKYQDKKFTSQTYSDLVI